MPTSNIAKGTIKKARAFFVRLSTLKGAMLLVCIVDGPEIATIMRDEKSGPSAYWGCYLPSLSEEDLFGIVFLHRKHLDPGTIAHEANHAAVDLLRKHHGSLEPVTEGYGEHLAAVVDEIVAAIYAAMPKRKITRG